MEFFANLFEPVVVIFRTVFGLFYDVTASAGFPSYGIAIILMTIVVKMALYPLTEKQIRSMKAMQEIQPVAFTHEPFHPIAGYCIAQLLASSKAYLVLQPSCCKDIQN